ncbi:hypothetical protein BH10BDE1_BH10BDE1_28050 [soil metagenome]
MADLSWLAQEAHRVHAIFESFFYAFVLFLFLLGVFFQYFQWPLGHTPSFAPLIGRVFVAALLLHAYPEISNLVADVADAMANRLGDLNQFSLVQKRYSEVWDQMSWNWVSVKDTISMAITYCCFYLLFFSVYLSDAFFLYTWTLLYVFSPLLIALYILPATASATTALFRSLIEVACWKIVWAVLATLLWSAGLASMNQPGVEVPFLTVIGFDLILAGSVLLTPLVVHGLAGAGLTGATRTIGAIAVGGLTLSPLTTANGIRRSVVQPIPTKLYHGFKNKFQDSRDLKSKSQFKKSNSNRPIKTSRESK